MRRMLAPHSITRTFMTYLIFLSVLPLVIVGWTSYQTSRRTLEEESRQYTRELVTNQKEYLDLQIDQIESLLANISGVEEIRDTLESEDPQKNTYTELVTQARIGYILNGYSNLEGLVSIDIFTVNYVHYHVGDTLNVENIRQDVRNALFAKALDDDSFVVWAGIEDNVNANSTHKKVVTAIKTLNHINHATLQQEPIALFLVNYSAEDLHTHFSKTNLGEGAYLLVLDGENRYIYHPDPAQLGQTAPDELTSHLTDSSGSVTTSIAGESMAVNYTHSDRTDWAVISLVPLDTLAAKTAPIGRTTTLVLVASFSVVLVTALFFNQNIVAPIQEITARFQQLQEDKPGSQAHLPVRGNDEIAELMRWFNTFMDSLAEKREAEAQIQASLQEKDVLLKEIHHRVKNNLQIISSLLNLQMEEVEDPDIQHIFQDSKNRVRSMALIHEKLYQSQNLARIDFAGYVRNLSDYLLRTYRAAHVRLTVEADEVYFGVDTAVPCSLILNELISNAIKHAFPNGRSGQITIELRTLPNEIIHLSVRDDGIGLDSYVQSQSPSSLGLQLVRTLVNQLHGKIELVSQNGQSGTEFQIIFPTL
ncbi:MAG: ATP-binding protein [Anaerolineales bacterium]|nr:ATP-binding protein [Anaerolineales bacterium]MCB9005518.1 ATP-binding protein [Ardenticatenaceae bacterium]